MPPTLAVIVAEVAPWLRTRVNCAEVVDWPPAMVSVAGLKELTLPVVVRFTVTVPPLFVTTLPNASRSWRFAVTVRRPAFPLPFSDPSPADVQVFRLPTGPVHVRAGVGCVTLLSPRLVAAAGLTVMALWVPVMVPVTVSVAVIDWVPAVLSVTERVWIPASRTGEGVVGRQDRLGVAAGEVDRAGVGRGHVAAGVFGRDRHVVGRPGRGRGGEARDDEGGRRPDVDRDARSGCP